MTGRLAGVALQLTALAVFVCMGTMLKLLTAHFAVPQLMWARFFFSLIAAAAFFRLVTGRLPWRSKAPWLQAARSLLLAGSNLMFSSALVHLPLTDCTAIGFASAVHRGAGRGLAEGAGRAAALGRRRHRLPRRAGGAAAALPDRRGADALGRHPAARHRGDVRGLLDPDPQAGEHRRPAHHHPAYRLRRGDRRQPGAALRLDPADRAGMGRCWSGSACSAGSGMGCWCWPSPGRPASLLAPMSYTQLIWATVAGVLVFADWPDLTTLAGAAVIALGGVLVALPDRGPPGSHPGGLTMAWNGVGAPDRPLPCRRRWSSP